ncbi:GDP-mannose 4,6-dehydratase [Candidatus Bathyarchaeota archaeon]|nr:MAG: GDP-mannose 4,6-dehydratase [Candidatus Bathyarchaeota archaeon]
MNKTAIIFGITGQDGSYLAELLLKKGYKVVGVTRRVSVSTLERIDHILPEITIVEGDITDGFNVSKIIEEFEPDEVYNLAAQSHVGTSFKQPSLTWDVTAGGVLNILEAIRYSPRKDSIRFYQASSSEMFGKNFTEMDDDPMNLVWGFKYQDENTAFMPQSPYAIAKLAAHHLVRNYRDSYGIHGSCGILFNHESERRGEHFVTRKITKWIGEFKNWAQENGAVDLQFDDDMICHVRKNPDNKPYGDNDSWVFGSKFPKLRLGNLDAKRDWGHAEDYVNVMWLMLQQDTPDDYVVATGETYSVRHFLNVAFYRIGIDDWTQYVVVDPEFYRPAEVDYLLGIPRKAEEKLGWRRDVSFEALVNRMVDYDVKKKKLRVSSLQELPKCCVKT